jgi:hypothetical protein
MMIRLTALAVLIATGASAFEGIPSGNRHDWGLSSYIELVPLPGPDPVARVVFVNAMVHPDARVAMTLEIDGLAVEVEVLIGRGATPDEVWVTPPEGFIAVPAHIAVPEDEAGTIDIRPADRLLAF